MKTESKLYALRAIRHRLAQPNSWTQHALARDTLGRVVATDSKEARRWCILGAVECLGLRVENWDEILQTIAAEIDPEGEPSEMISSFNDRANMHQDRIVKLLDTVIATVEKRR